VHILPEFQCAAPFIRAKACSCFSVFINASKTATDQVYITGVEQLLVSITDRQLLVRVTAGICLSIALRCNIADDVIGRNLNQLFPRKKNLFNFL
jgi:hypothetical protein